MTVRVGLGTLSGQLPFTETRTAGDVYREMLELARLAEEVGFDSFWLSSHHGAPNSHLPSPIVLLAAVAAVTKRIELGAAMVIAPLQPPLRFAEDCAVADQISRGRLIVGLSAGWRPEEFSAFGIDMRERARRTAELAQICRAAWDDGRVTFAGRHDRVEDAAVTPRPYRRLPLFMGGTAPSAVARAGRLADGFLSTGTPQKGVIAFEAEVRAFDAAARAAGRDPAGLAIGFNVNAWASADGAVPLAVRGAMWHKIGTSLAWHAGQQTRHDDDVPALDEARVAERGFFGTAEDVVRQAEPWVAPHDGRDLHVLFRLYHPGMRASDAAPAIRLFGERVIPALKEMHARAGAKGAAG
ncbi:MAG: LLM class flavin-dependent oxidoreductase [Chloroflexota bacterium]|nr:LLM class flavin-dependent oxidoreductase [Chloroflexota bacterium]MDE3101658.1 LLM class flavin-dependent oxidoreductase [Chloroflexota bacterium]